MKTIKPATPDEARKQIESLIDDAGYIRCYDDVLMALNEAKEIIDDLAAQLQRLHDEAEQEELDGRRGINGIKSLPFVTDVECVRWWDLDGTTWFIYLDTANDFDGVGIDSINQIARAFPRAELIRVCAKNWQGGRFHMLVMEADDAS